MPQRRRRGYPSAVIVSLDEGKANIWQVYSESIKQLKSIDAEGAYRLHEEIISAIRPMLREGTINLIIASRDSRSSQGLVDHMEKGHGWVSRSGVSVSWVEGIAGSPKEARALVSGEDFQRVLGEGYERESSVLVGELDRRLLGGLLYTPSELLESLGRDEVDRVIISEIYYMRNRGVREFQSSVQLARNKGVKVNIVKRGSEIESRISKLGGFVALRGT
jgi:stalled ribosome rescue protein Dom34